MGGTRRLGSVACRSYPCSHPLCLLHSPSHHCLTVGSQVSSLRGYNVRKEKIFLTSATEYIAPEWGKPMQRPQ